MSGKFNPAWGAVCACLASLALLFLIREPLGAQTEAIESRPGKYRGYSQPVYDEWVRTSQYIAVRDGTRLAADIFRPAKGSIPTSEPLPVIWAHDIYHRADVIDGRLRTQLDEDPWLQTVIKHGYVIGVVDLRGGGASYGTRQGTFTRQEAWDAYDITEWFAAQAWCNGRIGMYGRSYLGITQYLAASTAPPHLKAIFPEMAMFDLYSSIYPGGVFRHDFTTNWSRLVKRLGVNRQIAPVDEDQDRAMLAKALQEHEANRDIVNVAEQLQYRDSRDEQAKVAPYLHWNPASYLSKINQSGIAIYHLAGWYDLWPRDALVWFHNLRRPQKIIIGPWFHGQTTGLDLAAEHLRWYDYWLKGIDNGIMTEAPIHFYTMGAPKGQEWRSAWQWPLPNEQPTRFYLHPGPSKSINSVNDGVLSTGQPTGDTSRDDYPVNYTTTSGKATRWTNGYGGAAGYRNMALNDERGLTYTTPPLDATVEVTGHPIIHLWVTSTAKDGDFFVYLEEASRSGYSQYVTEGVLRASHRAVSAAPFNYLNLPYHRSYQKDLAYLPSQPVELVIDLYPTSNIFEAGNRIRVTITCADQDNALSPELSPSPTVSLYHTAKYSSYITLPVIATTADTVPPADLHTVDPTEANEGGRPIGIIVLSVSVSAIVLAALLSKFFKRSS